MHINFFDTETSDTLDKNPNAEIIAYSCQSWVNGVRGPMQTVHLLPRGPVSEGAAKVNGYTPEEWARRGAIRHFDWQDATNLQNMLDGQIVGGHNTKFDLDMVAATFKRANIKRPDWNYRVVDTQANAQLLVGLGVLKSARLTEVAAYFGINTNQAHTSAGDVDITIQVWECLCHLVLDGFQWRQFQAWQREQQQEQELLASKGG